MQKMDRVRESVNLTRYRPGQREGHYESYFQRANHPSRPLAFWIRYTIFSPHGRPGAAVGELWAVYFDGETGRHVAVTRHVPLDQCHFDGDRFNVRVADAVLEPGLMRGVVENGEHSLAWDLTFRGDAPPLLLLPSRLYETGFPAAKSLVGLPLAVYQGMLRVDGAPMEIAGWVGSQNHNWGRRHTDEYAWGQVAGFDTHPASFLEVATARLRIGPLWTPRLTVAVLRHDGEEIRLNAPRQMLRARAVYGPSSRPSPGPTRWSFRAETAALRVAGVFAAAPESFVLLRYDNPPGGHKQCLNSKIASCSLTITRKASGRSETLHAPHRAAFELLADAPPGTWSMSVPPTA